MATSSKKQQQEQPAPAAPAAPAASDPVEESSIPASTPAPLRRLFAGGGHIPELGLFVGSGHVLAEQQPDGTWRLVEEASPLPVDIPVDAPAPDTDATPAE